MTGAAPASEALTRLARTLLDQVEELVEDFVEELRAVEPYAAETVPRHVIRADARRSFLLILRLITGTPVPDRIAAVSSDVGRTRAEAGVPLDALLHAVRLDFRVVWQALYNRAQPADMASLVVEGPRVWEAVEQHSMGVLAAYQQRVLEMARAEQDERARWFARLLDSDGRHADVCRQVATVLDFDEDARFAVVALPPDQLTPLRKAQQRLSSRGVRLHMHERASSTAVIVQLPPRHTTGATQWFKGVRCAVGPVVRGLRQVPRALRLAETTLHVLPADTPAPHTTADLWVRVAATQLGEFAADLTDDTLGGLDTLANGDEVLAAVVSYLRTGSLADTARELYCHRNTVLNRLHKFTAATGRDVTSPPDAAVVALALAAREPNHPYP
ncbi:MAG: PucR family transcriptional regulator [Streptosporangiales bacterium]|nr:PucR family transcriptional regulator [Streptosporangiales bacterium]